MDINNKLHMALTQRKLREWGYWYNAVLLSGLSYKAKNIIYTLVENKGEIIQSSVTGTFNHADAEQIDTLINQLSHIYPKQADVIKVHYSYDGTFIAKANFLGLKKMTYSRYLKQAEEWLCRFLEFK